MFEDPSEDAAPPPCEGTGDGLVDHVIPCHDTVAPPSLLTVDDIDIVVFVMADGQAPVATVGTTTVELPQ